MKSLIVSDAKVMMGKPVIQGTRITVEHILEEFAAGRTYQELLDAYPSLTHEGIQAALEFAAQMLKDRESFDKFLMLNQLGQTTASMTPHEALEGLRQLRSSLPEVDIVELMRASRQELE